MTVELALYIGSTWIQDEPYAPNGFDQKYGRSIRQVAYIDLSTVTRSMWDLIERHQKLANEQFKADGTFWHITTRVQVDDDEKNLTEDSYGFRIPCIPLVEVRDTIKAFDGWERFPNYSLAIAIIDTYLERYQGGVYGSPVALAYGH